MGGNADSKSYLHAMGPLSRNRILNCIFPCPADRKHCLAQVLPWRLRQPRTVEACTMMSSIVTLCWSICLISVLSADTHRGKELSFLVTRAPGPGLGPGSGPGIGGARLGGAPPPDALSRSSRTDGRRTGRTRPPACPAHPSAQTRVFEIACAQPAQRPCRPDQATALRQTRAAKRQARRAT